MARIVIFEKFFNCFTNYKPAAAEESIPVTPDADYQISTNFKFKEVIQSETAQRYGIDNTPSPLAVLNLFELVKKVLQPIRTHIGSYIILTSGFRSLSLNTKVGGDNSSQHMKGEAADFIVPGHNLEEIWLWIVLQSNLKFDQVILEFGDWIHISYIRDGEPRGKISISYKAKIPGQKRLVTRYKHYTVDQIRSGGYLTPWKLEA